MNFIAAQVFLEKTFAEPSPESLCKIIAHKECCSFPIISSQKKYL